MEKDGYKNNGDGDVLMDVRPLLGLPLEPRDQEKTRIRFSSVAQSGEVLSRVHRSSSSSFLSHRFSAVIFKVDLIHVC
jgi:hypothetical protein